MQEKTDAQLLRDYAEHRNEAAFRELVSRHADVVYASALRQVSSPDLAQDITQSVFTDLARKAQPLTGTLTGDASLLGWLFRSTRFLALNQLRDDRRRQARERQAMQHFDSASETAPAWERVQPVLDEAMADLSDEDRDALLLRFFKNRDFRAIGATLGVSDDAAQKRVSRALERLRTQLTSKGVTTTAGALSAALATNAVPLAPAGLAATLSTAALGGTTLAATATATAIKIITLTTLQKTVLTAALAAAVGTGVYEARQISHLRSENQNLITQQEALADERDKALDAVTGKDGELDRLQKDKNELLRLRGEVGLLRRQTKDFEKLREENDQLQASLVKSSQAAQSPAVDPEDTPERRGAIAKMTDAKMLVLGLMLHASDNQDQLPADLSQTTNYLGNAEQGLTGTNQFELVAQGSLKSFTNPAATIVVREKDVSFYNGKWAKTYGFADGHSEIKREPPEGFDAWEQQHMISPATNR